MRIVDVKRKYGNVERRFENQCEKTKEEKRISILFGCLIVIKLQHFKKKENSELLCLSLALSASP
jgi:hypothetical protein